MKRICSLLLLLWLLCCCHDLKETTPAAEALAAPVAAVASVPADSEWQWQLVRSTLMAIPADGETAVTQTLARTIGTHAHTALKRMLTAMPNTVAVSRAQHLSLKSIDRHLAAISHANGMDIYGRCQMRC